MSHTFSCLIRFSQELLEFFQLFIILFGELVQKIGQKYGSNLGTIVDSCTIGFVEIISHLEKLNATGYFSL